jgi:hypothetical protein
MNLQSSPIVESLAPPSYDQLLLPTIDPDSGLTPSPPPPFDQLFPPNSSHSPEPMDPSIFPTEDSSPPAMPYRPTKEEVWDRALKALDGVKLIKVTKISVGNTSSRYKIHDDSGKLIFWVKYLFSFSQTRQQRPLAVDLVEVEVFKTELVLKLIWPDLEWPLKKLDEINIP